MKPYHVGIIGFGTEGVWHAHQIEISDFFELAGVSDIAESRKLLAQEKGIRFYNSNKALLADPQIDVVIIATPNNSHNELSIEALEAGKHVICEKPAAGNCAEFEEMIEVARKHDRVLSVYQNRRWDGDYLTVRRIFESGRIGEISRIESRIHGSRGIPKTWMRENRYEGGVLWDWGAHVIDQILALKPGKKVSYVSATMSHMTDADVEDGFTAMLIFEDGVESIVEVSTNNLIPLPRWYLTGKKGSAMIKDFRSGAELATLVEEETEEVLAARIGTGMTKMMVPRRAEEVHKSAMPVVEELGTYDYYCNIAEVIAGKSEPFVKLSESLRVLRLMEAVKKAAIAHETVWFEG